MCVLMNMAICIAAHADFPTRARDLYASLGFRLVKEFPRYRKSPDWHG